MARNKFDVDENLESPFSFSHLKRAMKYIGRHRGKMLLALLFSSIASVTSLFGPKILEWTLDTAVPNKDFALLGLLAGGYVALVLVGIGFITIRSRIMAHVSQEIIYDIREDLFAHLQKLPFSYYDSRPAGKILVRVINYVNSVSDMLSNGIINSILEIINIIFIVIFMFGTNAVLAAIIVAGLPIFAAVILLLKPRQRRAWQGQSNKNSNYNAYLAESIDGVKVSQLFARQEENLSIMQRLASACRAAWLKAVVISNTVWFSSELMTQIVFTFMYIAGVYWMGGAMVSFGVLMAMGQYVSRFWQPITNLANIYNMFINNIAYLERIFETMDEPVTVGDAPDAVELPPIQGRVEFRDVTFGYEPEVNILEHIDLQVAPGQSIALVGPTGAGKTTVVNLISRFYNLTSGQILIDGEWDIAQVTLHSLRSQMGIMLQDSFIFSGTILDNLRYGRLDATEEEVVAAARAVCAHDFIMEMEKGYLTEVNERGSRLSQGQRQLIAFARTLLSDPRILILDEATSSIDTRTERLLQEGIQTLMKGRTSFIIAHRLSTIKHCDRILYIGDKGILEQGSHQELLAKRGLYYQLYTAQSRLGGVEEPAAYHAPSPANEPVLI
ncbi:MAG: ABC transporter ATP-binding protein [Clostridiales bacterium]|jgi:ATP-binding cassette subfamily B multidrug efflux pump|nr:ABC transporter ATP-binding protein [Clostridiales bacterium]